jgi:DNA-binding transcriptional LysR family regulator
MSKWDGIDEFLAVAAANSFTKAAHAIGMSPTHVSRAIGQLEERLQTVLFHRTTRKVSLTDAGRVFFEHCQRIAEERDEAIALISEQGEPQGELKVTCSSALGERFVAPILRRFAASHPRVRIHIELTNRMVDLVSEGFDLAIRTGTIADPRLLGTWVASRRLHTCAAPDYLKRFGCPTTIEELQAHECIVGTGSTWHYEVEGREVAHRPSGRFRCNSGQAVIEACVSGFGLCQLPEFYVLPYLQHGMVDLVLEDVRPKDEPIWAVYPRRRHLMPKIRNVLEILKLELGPAMNVRTPEK